MPALGFLRRKWLVGCDDLVIPFAVDAATRIIWLICTLFVITLKIKNCDDLEIVNYFLYGVCGDLLLTSVLSLCLSFTSAQGSVLEVEKRKLVTSFLYMKCATILCDMALGSFGIYLFIFAQSTCTVKDVFMKMTTVFAFGYVLVVAVVIFVCYDSLGSSKYWDTEKNVDTLNFFKKAQYIWKLRLKLLCCCADISEENDLIYVEISTFLASFLNGIDLVPTDILAGIITLSQKHALESRKDFLDLHPLSATSLLLENRTVPSWMSPKNAYHFLRIAKSTYGWLAFFDALRPWNLCHLFSHMKCCCSPPSDTQQDNCCRCNVAAVQKITGFPDDDILYASFHASIHEPAFYVAIDHAQRCVVIAIRGTRSFSDLVTDIDAENLFFPAGKSSATFQCHRGTLRSALFILSKLEDMNILGITFAGNPTYTLALTGHSLGGSIAAVLALLLRPKFPGLQCYAYAPMAVLSAAGVEETLDCVFSVAIGDDVTPRLCAGACHELRKEIMESLKGCKAPKYKILLDACWYHVQKYFKVQVPKRECKGYENTQFEQDDDTSTQLNQSVPIDESKLYAPGRILYYDVKTNKKPFWLTGFNFRKIIINPAMISDHQPHKIQSMLEMYIKEEMDFPQKINEILI